MGTVFFVGSFLTVLGLKKGDVSLVTPLMGTKVVFVALAITIFTGGDVSLLLWIAAALTSIGIFVMGMGDMRVSGALLFTIGIALTCAMVYGACDVIVSSWSNPFGAMTFLSVGSVWVGVLSGIVWFLQGRPALVTTPAATKWAAIGGVFIAIQAVLMGVSLSLFASATRINVIYASRGLFTIVLLVCLARLFGLDEHRQNKRVFLFRVIGTVILTAAIVIAVFDKAK